MKNSILVVLLVVAGFYIHKNFSKKSEAVQAYISFTNAMFNGRFNEAAGLCSGDQALNEIQRRKGQYEYAERTGDLGTINSVEYKVKSENYSTDGKKATLSISQGVHCAKKQLMSNMSSVTINFNHTSELVKTVTGWKINSFQFIMGDPKPTSGNNFVGYFD